MHHLKRVSCGLVVLAGSAGPVFGAVFGVEPAKCPLCAAAAEDKTAQTVSVNHVVTEPEGEQVAIPVLGSEPEDESESETAAEPDGQPNEQAATDPAAAIPGNMLVDPGFEVYGREDTDNPWWNFARRGSQAWIDYTISETVSLSGDHSAWIHIDSRSQQPRTSVHGVIQTFEGGELPRYVSGYYFVRNWQRGAPRQYIQTVVMAKEPSNQPAGFGSPWIQVAMTMGGVDRPPLNMQNRRFEVTGPIEPPVGEWVFFEFDLHQLFNKHWGLIPVDFGELRVFFEARYDYRQPGTDALADVYFDDLYFGSESRASE